MAGTVSINSYRGTPSEPIPLKSSLSWYQRGLSTNCARTALENRTLPQKIGATSIGQVLGFGVALAGIGDLIYKVFYSDSDSIWNKYITPVLITCFGLSGAGASKPPRNVLGVDVISNGINNVISHFKSLEDTSIVRFTKEIKKELTASLENILNSIETTLYRVNTRIQGGQRVIDPREEMKKVFSPDDELRGEYFLFYKNLNSALERAGFILEHDYEKGRINLFIKSKNVFSSPHNKDFHYQPFLLFPFETEEFRNILTSLNNLFSCNDVSDKEIIQELIGLLTGNNSPFIQGYTALDKDKKGHKKLLPRNIEYRISSQNRSILENFISTEVIHCSLHQESHSNPDDDAPAILPFKRPK